MVNAIDVLANAHGHLVERAKTYDNDDGERSVPKCVEAFNAITGHKITSEQGWLFLALLKAVRSQQGAFKMDSYEDGAAYFALAGEQASQDRSEGV